MRSLFVSLLLVLVTGCASVELPGPSFTDAPKPAANDYVSVIYFYRTDSVAGENPYRDIRIDGKKLLVLNDGGFTWTTTDKKKIKITAEIPWYTQPEYPAYNPAELSIALEQGKTYYVNLDIEIKRRKGNSHLYQTAGFIDMFADNGLAKNIDKLISVNKDDAVNEMSKSKYEKPSWQ